MPFLSAQKRHTLSPRSVVKRPTFWRADGRSDNDSALLDNGIIIAIIICMPRITQTLRAAQRAAGRIGLREAAQALGTSHPWLWRQLRAVGGLVMRDHGALWVDLAALASYYEAAGHPDRSAILRAMMAN